MVTTHAEAKAALLGTVEPICHRHKTVTMNHVKMALRCFNPIMVLARCAAAWQDIYAKLTPLQVQAMHAQFEMQPCVEPKIPGKW